MFHAGPLSMMNHGFYNVCPVMFENYFHANGCTVVNFNSAFLRPPYEMEPLPMTQRVTHLPQRETIFLSIVEKQSHSASFVKPVQGRYRKAGRLAVTDERSAVPTLRDRHRQRALHPAVQA